MLIQAVVVVVVVVVVVAEDGFTLTACQQHLSQHFILRQVHTGVSVSEIN